MQQKLTFRPDWDKVVTPVVDYVSRDILCYSMRKLDRMGLSIVMSVHDEVVIETSHGVSLEVVCRCMGETPPWKEGLMLRADGFLCPFYKKD